VADLVQLVAERTGLSQEGARIAVELVLNFVKQKLPAPMAAHLDTMLAGAGAMDQLDDLTKGFGGLFGGKSD